MKGHCKACGYTGDGWRYLGPQLDERKERVLFFYWNCPRCHSTRSSHSDKYPPLR